MTGIYRRILERIERSPATIVERRISLTAWEKTWVAARSLAGGAASGRRQTNGTELVEDRVA
jgi:phytoene/squalene synthetase